MKWALCAQAQFNGAVLTVEIDHIDNESKFPSSASLQ